MISGPVMIAPVFDVDGDDDDDHALLGQHPAVAQHAVADVADDAVDVEVAGRHLADAVEPVVVELELVAVLAHAARGRRATPICRASSAWATRWRYSPCTGMNHSGWAIDRSVFSSSCLAWPVAWTSAMPGVHDLGARGA